MAAPAVSPNNVIKAGTALAVPALRLNWMKIKDAHSGYAIWSSTDLSTAFQGEMKVSMPIDLLKCHVVARELNFTLLSPQPLGHLRVKQEFLVNGMVMEEWDFEFGFVIPNSTNSWETLMEGDVEAARELDEADWEGTEVVVLTRFFDGERELGTFRLAMAYTQ
ncbi:hypothetical protein AMAG_01735 [Allomyces macrogynus ATCC 38327]|uniref:GMP phosphodiesterase delta subunit domain-containing protein n=1 Tax=Allomyces macrogynus (strain ATCC 38327) TaxID=578462 RepID=A0A0L0RZL7_ALLM3|nr:hypothetical protein AMAG_01735 [Allomyces macrogynus ATCC 38327]|eukprot:KNE55867.1 hypothetical protein AMAG_01735 [Allomyces macrogynus ATCC 38327]